MPDAHPLGSARSLSIIRQPNARHGASVVSGSGYLERRPEFDRSQGMQDLRCAVA
jgi:hypothetical protein